MTQLAEIPQPMTPPAATLLVRCLGCEYDLRGLPRDARCPECGLSVEPSHQRAETESTGRRPPLRLSSTPWLRNLAIACCLMLLVALFTAWDAVRVVRDADRGEDGIDIVEVIVGIAHLALMVAACWVFGTRQPLETRAAAAGRSMIRIGGGLTIVLPFALMPLMSRFGAMPHFFSRVSVVFSLLAGVLTWLIGRRLADGARRAGWIKLGRFASCYAWLAGPAWIVHALINPSMPYKPHAEWMLNAHPVIGYLESLVAMPHALLTAAQQWDDDAVARLLPWVIEAAISLASLIILALMARLFFIAARESPRPSSV